MRNDGKLVEMGLKELKDCPFGVLYDDAILWFDESHCRQVLGSVGHKSSFSRIQYRVSVDPKTGALVLMSKGGCMPCPKF